MAAIQEDGLHGVGNIQSAASGVGEERRSQS